MKMSNIIIVLITLFATNSCSRILNENQKSFPEEQTSFHAQVCEDTHALIIANSQTQLIEFSEVSKRAKNSGLSTIEIGALLMLLQMNLRPDVHGPYSSAVTLINTNNKWRFFTTNDCKNTTCYFSLIESFLSEYKQKSLSKIAQVFKAIVPDEIPITAQLENFIRDNEKRIVNNALLKKNYFRGEQHLIQSETIHKIDFGKLITELTISKNAASELTLRRYNTNVECSLDMKQYDLGLYDQSSTQTDTSSFVLAENNIVFIELSSTTLDKNKKERQLNPFHNTLMFDQAQNQSSSEITFCLFKDNNSNENLVISSDGRDPAQLLFHLINKPLAISPKQLEAARSLTLQNPNRVLFESSDPNRLSNPLNNTNIPIYYYPKIGSLWSIQNDREGHSTVILDGRKKDYMFCNSNNGGTK